MKIQNKIAITEEITEKTSAENALKEFKKFAELIYKVSPSAIFTVDNEKRITSWNDRATQITGFSQEEIIGKSCAVFAEKPCPSECGLFDTLTQKPIKAKECFIIHKSGRKIIISKNADILKDISGNIIGGIESFEDITEHKWAEEAIRESEMRYRVLFKNSGDAIMILEPPSWQFTSGNLSAVRMFMAKDETEFIAKEPWKLSPERQPDGRNSSEKPRK